MKMMKYLKVYRLLVYLTLSFTVCYGDTKKKALKKKRAEIIFFRPPTLNLKEISRKST